MDDLFVGNAWLAPLIRSAVVLAMAIGVSAVVRRLGGRTVERIERKNPRNARRAATWWLVMRRVITVIVWVIAGSEGLENTFCRFSCSSVG